MGAYSGGREAESNVRLHIPTLDCGTLRLVPTLGVLQDKLRHSRRAVSKRHVDTRLRVTDTRNRRSFSGTAGSFTAASYLELRSMLLELRCHGRYGMQWSRALLCGLQASDALTARAQAERSAWIALRAFC